MTLRLSFPFVHRVRRIASFSAASARWPPARRSAAMAAPYTSSRMTMEFSDEHDVALSKHFDLRIFSAASSSFAVESMMTGTLPAPTPIAGVPLR